jgi:hypothetical protein
MALGTQITNYGQLIEAITTYADRTDLATIIPTFIGLAEKKIFRELRTPSLEKKVYFDAIEDGTYKFALPPRLLEIKNVRTKAIPPAGITNENETDGISIEFKPVSLFYNPETPDGCYTREIGNIWFKGAIPKGQRITILYYEDLSGLNDPDDTNLVLLRNWDLYLYGALAELPLYLMDEQRIAIWKAMFAESMQSANAYAKAMDWKSSPTQLRMPR